MSFRYSNQSSFLYEHLGVAVPSGACVAVMGPSGSGKSTRAKLLQGFYMPDHGSISVCARDIRQLAANELRQHFGVVPQETRLFSGAVYDNIVLANPHAGVDDVVAACRMAPHTRDDRKAARGLSGANRRAWCRTFRRTETAHRDRACAA